MTQKINNIEDNIFNIFRLPNQVDTKNTRHYGDNTPSITWLLGNVLDWDMPNNESMSNALERWTMVHRLLEYLVKWDISHSFNAANTLGRYFPDIVDTTMVAPLMYSEVLTNAKWAKFEDKIKIKWFLWATVDYYKQEDTDNNSTEIKFPWIDDFNNYRKKRYIVEYKTTSTLNNVTTGGHNTELDSRYNMQLVAQHLAIQLSKWVTLEKAVTMMFSTDTSYKYNILYISNDGVYLKKNILIDSNVVYDVLTLILYWHYCNGTLDQTKYNKKTLSVINNYEILYLTYIKKLYLKIWAKDSDWNMSIKKKAIQWFLWKKGLNILSK